MTGSPPRAILASRAARLAGLALCLHLAAAGCATAPLQVTPNPVPGVSAPATVFVADGAGNYQMASRSLRAVIVADAYPIDVQTFEWSHGLGRMVADHTCYQYARAQGRTLAELVQAYHACHPDTPLYLLGHSAGATAVMAALENLPPGVVDGAVLLSPSLSAHYDVRPALAAVDGLYVFHSRQDYGYLGVVTGLLGTSDRRWAASSGRVGFRVPAGGAADPAYAKLYQRAWYPADRALGNQGGHYGNYQPDFLRAHIVPRLQPGEVITPAGR